VAAITLEVCCYDIESAINAIEGGADRVELCADRHLGGTTPSYGTMEVVRKHLNIPVFAMIRPRGGDFLYSAQEVEAMMFDIQMAKELGMEGVVLGALTKHGQVNAEAIKPLIEIARPMQVTFHRAFDLTPDATKSLEILISLGVDRILTSGQANTVAEGVDVLKQLVEVADGKITIMPGAGFNEENIVEILRKTKATECHVSASGTRPSHMEYQHQGVLMGDAQSEYSLTIADSDRIKNYQALLETV
jgi:copper homeostasis protein